MPRMDNLLGDTPRGLLPAMSASTEVDIARLIADTNPDFPLSQVNAGRAVRGPQGAIRAIAGQGGRGADVVFRGPAASTLRREVKSIAGGAQGSFNREIAAAASQLGYQGEVFVQVPRGTAALNKVLRFRGARQSPADLGLYRSVHIIIVDDVGTVLYQGPLVL